MERAAQRQAQASGKKTGKRWRKTSDKSRMSPDEMAVFYADLVNSDKFMAASTISNATRNAMLARGLVTPDRLRMRGVL